MDISWLNNIEYERVEGSNLSKCPHGTLVYWADECDACLEGAS